jgi:hypothetical protein
MNPLFSSATNSLPEASSKWQALSQNLAGVQRQKAMDASAVGANAGMIGAMSALGERGNNVGGSMERLAGKGVSAYGQGAAMGAQGVNQTLAGNIAGGIQGIDLPMLQGQDLARTQKYASDVNKKSGIMGYINSFAGG